MTKYDILNQVKHIQKDIQLKKQLVTTYRTIAEGMQSPQYTDMPKSQNRNLHPMEDALHKALALEDEILELEKQLSQVKQRIFTIIHQIDNNEYQLLLLERYINEQPWNVIIKKMSYCRSRVYELHNEALVQFYGVFENFGL